MQKSKIKEIVQLFREYHKFIVTSHVNIDGDALGSELGLYFALEQLQKEVLIVNQDPVPYIYKFMPGIDKIVSAEQNDKKFPLEIDTDTVLVVLDSSNLERIGNIPVEIDKLGLILNIDHHPSNSNFGHINYVDTESSSTGEIIYQLCKELDCQLTEQIAIPLFTAIVTDTGSFRFTNTKAETFQTAFHLTLAGANPHLINDAIYNNNEISALKLLGESLVNLKINSKLGISWTIVNREMIEKNLAKEEETEGIVDKILSIKDIQISILFKETLEKKVKISFRSRGQFDVDHFARIFGGGGHPNAAGCLVEGSIYKVEKLILGKLEDVLNKKASSR